MGRSSKISVKTPGELYKKIAIRAYDLELQHREYFLLLALLDHGLVEDGPSSILTPDLIEKAKAKLKEFDEELK